jgi:hypothetical protein
MGMATLGHVVASWLDGSSGDLDEHIVRAFHEVRDLSLSSSELVRGHAGNRQELSTGARPTKKAETFCDYLLFA